MQNISWGHASGEIYFHSVTVTIQGLDRRNIFWVHPTEEIYFYSVTVTIQGLDRVNIFWGVWHTRNIFSVTLVIKIYLGQSADIQATVYIQRRYTHWLLVL